MDANGTRFHLVLGAADWAACSDDTAGFRAASGTLESESDGGTKWEPAAGEMTLRPLPFQFPAPPFDRPVTHLDRRGAAADRYGNWYWIGDGERTILVKSAGSGLISTFFPAPEPERKAAAPGAFFPMTETAPPTPAIFGGLAVTLHHYLVVGTVTPPGFLLFDLHAGGPPQVLNWPLRSPEISFAPFDMAAAPDGGVRVLDREHGCCWLLDSHFRIISAPQPAGAPVTPTPDDFQPLSGGPQRTHAPASAPLGISLSTAVPVPVVDPIAIEVTAGGDILILDRSSGGQVFRIGPDAELGLPVQLHIETAHSDGPDADQALDLHDFAYLPGDGNSLPERIYVVTSEGNQAFAFDLPARGGVSLDPVPEYRPMRLFQGKALCAAAGGIFYDYPGGFVPLVEQQRPRYVKEAVLSTPHFDGREPGCVWHRLFIDGRIPDGAEVRVQSRAADSLAELIQKEYADEPPLYRRGDGAELPFLSSEAIGNLDTFELLFQRAQGRHLQVRLFLTGNGRVTPRLHALRAWYPRFSYLSRYLPGAYHEDADSASFLDRFLANPEGIFTSIEDRIAAAHLFLDVRSAPAETLDWLASWFGVALDPAWDELRRRLFIRHAMTFFQYRGTARGLRMALRLVLDQCPDESIFTAPDDPVRATVRIVERFRARSVPGVYSGDVTEPVGIRLVSPEKRWQPEERGEKLHQRWRAALVAARIDAAPEYPIREPAAFALKNFWKQFSRNTLGFVPASTAQDVEVWQEFLASRYRSITALNKAYGSSPGLPSFTAAEMPKSLPQDGAPLGDWYKFEAIVQPMRQTAHRFRVLVPVPRGSSVGDEERLNRLQLVKRVVELEKPAHTTFEVRFYFAMFRVGEARLGFDSLVDLGGRAPDLMVPFVLGPTHLAEGYLAPRSPQDSADRSVLGRDRLGA